MVEQAIETAALMLGTDKSRGYCLKMICADFLAGANLDSEDPTSLLRSMSRFFKFLPGEQRQAFLHRGDLRTSIYCTINVSEDAWVAEPEIAVTVRV